MGASKLSEYGLYFQWADTSGYTTDQVGTGEEQKEFTWSDYKWYLGINDDGDVDLKKYDYGETLELEDDAAHANMGGDWHIPTPTQIQELIDNTTTGWTTSDGVSGMTFTSKKDTSKFIFIPAAGYAEWGSVEKSRTYGCVLSSEVWDYNLRLSQLLIITSEGADLDDVYDNYDDGDLYYGFSVRGVIG